MSLHDIFVLSKQVILSLPVLAILIMVFLFLALIFYVANYHKDVLDYSIPMTKNTKKNKKKS
ncbi:MAG: hypothetical protein ACTTKH_04295 [Treponema sp.]